MKARTALLGAAGVAVTGAAGLGLALAREYRRLDPAADDDFSALADLVHHTIATDDGAQLHVVERGHAEGRPLLFVHGVTLSTDVWRYQLRDLADEFRVLALDQRGHGRSVPGTDGWAVDRLGRDIATVLETLDLRGAIVVGHSMGGFATMKFCIDHPDVLADRVAGVTLINTSAGQFFGPGRERMLPVVRRAIVAGAKQSANANRHAAYMGTRVTLGRRPSRSHVRLTYDLNRATDPATMTGCVLAFLDMDLRDALKTVHVPAVVVAGSQDRLTPPRYARTIADRLAGAKLVILPGCGHMSMLERHDELDQLIADFSASLPAPARPSSLRSVPATG